MAFLGESAAKGRTLWNALKMAAVVVAVLLLASPAALADDDDDDDDNEGWGYAQQPYGWYPPPPVYVPAPPVYVTQPGTSSRRWRILNPSRRWFSRHQGCA